MTRALPDNPDLSWDLDGIANQGRARDFVLQFEQTLCVYSRFVKQVYSTYNMFFPREHNRKLVILPDPNAFHDTFFHIPPSAVMATGIYVVPGELVNRRGLQLANAEPGRSLGKRQVPFEKGVRAIANKRPPSDPFLPILVKGDLREFDSEWPALHMHRLRLDALTDRSELERRSLQEVIEEKIEALFAEERRQTWA
ncbi:MAG: hypothetical protein AAF515_12825 [Pseudomonadota bacterium]